jgi:hypothetical protein
MSKFTLLNSDLKHHLLIQDRELEISNLPIKEYNKDAIAIGDLEVIIAVHGIDDTLTPFSRVFLANSTTSPLVDITLFDKLIPTPKSFITER